MAKTWEQMTQNEKIEDLRRDIVEIMNFVNDLRKEHDALTADHQRIKVLTNEALTGVDLLKKAAGL